MFSLKQIQGERFWWECHSSHLPPLIRASCSEVKLGFFASLHSHFDPASLPSSLDPPFLPRQGPSPQLLTCHRLLISGLESVPPAGLPLTLLSGGRGPAPVQVIRSLVSTQGPVLPALCPRF